MYTKLVLSGGGHHGLSILGALEFVFPSLKNVDKYYGTSIGSVICFLLICGNSPFDIFQYFFETENIGDFVELDPKLAKMGLFKMTNFLKLIEVKAGEYAGMTFLELFEATKKELYVVGTNVDKMTSVVFSRVNYPNMPVMKALEISCSIPFVFERIVFEGDTYVDGGVSNNYPIDVAVSETHGTRSPGIDASSSHPSESYTTNAVFGICILSDYNLGSIEYINWVVKLLFIPSRELYKKKIQSLSGNVTHIEIQAMKDVSEKNAVLDLEMSKKQKTDLYIHGYLTCRDKLRESDKRV